MIISEIGIKDSFRKSALFLFLIGNALFVLSQPETMHTQVKKANDFYMQKSYDDAVALYEQVIASGYYSAELYYNLGNAYYKIANFPKSIFNFERARLLDRNNAKVLHNLKFAQQHVRDQNEVMPDTGIAQIFENILMLNTVAGWAYYSIALFIVCLVFMLIFLFANTIGFKKIGFGLAVFSFLLSSIFFLFAFRSQSQMVNNKTAIIMSQVSIAKSSPDKGSTDLFRIHEGLKVKVQDKSGEWVEIKLSDGRVGWILSEDLEEI